MIHYFFEGLMIHLGAAALGLFLGWVVLEVSEKFKNKRDTKRGDRECNG